MAKTKQGTTPDEMVERLTEAHTPKKFNAAAWIEGGGIILPESVFPVYIDLKTAYERLQLDEEIRAVEELALANAANVGDMLAPPEDPYEDRLRELRAKHEVLTARMHQNRVEFALRGIKPEANEALEKAAMAVCQDENGEPREDMSFADEVTIRRMVAMTQRISFFSADGEAAVDDGPWTEQEMRTIYMGLPPDQRAKLLDEVLLLVSGVKVAQQLGAATFPG
jgi:hypothetical protein